ncbi:MAG: TetR/AcrR family transcriptional regulator [Chakrabartia sp.]
MARQKTTANAMKAMPAEGRATRVRGVSKNPAEARRKLIEAAIALFARKGFVATSTEDVAERAGYGQATVFFHFKTKAGLLEACFDLMLDRARASLVAAEPSGTQNLLKRLDHYHAPHADFFARMMSELAGNARFGPIYAAFHAHMRDLIAAELHRETGADPDQCQLAAATLKSMMLGVHAEQRIAPGRFTPDQYAEMLHHVAELIIADLAGPKAAR